MGGGKLEGKEVRGWEMEESSSVSFCGFNRPFSWWFLNSYLKRSNCWALESYFYLPTGCVYSIPHKLNSTCPQMYSFFSTAPLLLAPQLFLLFPCMNWLLMVHPGTQVMTFGVTIHHFTHPVTKFCLVCFPILIKFIVIA